MLTCGLLTGSCPLLLAPQVPHIGNCSISTLVAEEGTSTWRVVGIGETGDGVTASGGEAVNVDMAPRAVPAGGKR